MPREKHNKSFIMPAPITCHRMIQVHSNNNCVICFEIGPISESIAKLRAIDPISPAYIVYFRKNSIDTLEGGEL